MSTTAASCVFVYGTLMAEEVVQTLLGRVPARCPAVISDYRRYAIINRQYPAIIPAPGSVVRGKVMFDLSPAEMKLLDLFEDEEYTREVVSAQPGEGQELPAGEEGPTGRLPIDASVYVWGDRLGKTLKGEWDYEAWRAQYLNSYVDMCKTFPDEGDGMELRLQLEKEQKERAVLEGAASGSDDQ